MTLYFTMALDTDPIRPLCYDLSFDDCRIDAVRLLREPKRPGELPVGWHDAVQDGVSKRRNTFPGYGKGEHRLDVRPLREGLVIEKVVIDLGV